MRPEQRREGIHDHAELLTAARIQDLANGLLGFGLGEYPDGHRGLFSETP